jgi:arylsulfatase A-like enzyme
MIAVWNGKILAGTDTDHPSAFWDVFPTLAEITGAKVPDDIDGLSFLPSLLGNQEKQKEHAYLYWEFHEKGGRKALRKGDWKLVQYDIFDPEKTKTELYNLENDLGEENNVAEDYPELVNELMGIMNAARTDSEIFTFNSGTYLQ